MRIALASACAFFVATLACASGDSGRRDGLLVVTTVSPIADIAGRVAGDRAEVEAIVPEGVDSHTFEPTTDSARSISEADLILVNGLHLEERIIELARSNAPAGTPIFSLGDSAADPSDLLYDFSFPRSNGRPNPHLWMSVPYAIEYTKLIADRLSEIAP